MGLLARSILVFLVLFGGMGAIIHLNSVSLEAITTTPYLDDGVIAAILRLMLCAVITVVYMIASVVYALKGWIVCAIIIVWCATWASKKEVQRWEIV